MATSTTIPPAAQQVGDLLAQADADQAADRQALAWAMALAVTPEVEATLRKVASTARGRGHLDVDVDDLRADAQMAMVAAAGRLLAGQARRDNPAGYIATAGRRGAVEALRNAGDQVPASTRRDREARGEPTGERRRVEMPDQLAGEPGWDPAVLVARAAERAEDRALALAVVQTLRPGVTSATLPAELEQLAHDPTGMRRLRRAVQAVASAPGGEVHYRRAAERWARDAEEAELRRAVRPGGTVETVEVVDLFGQVGPPAATRRPTRSGSHPVRTRGQLGLDLAQPDQAAGPELTAEAG